MITVDFFQNKDGIFRGFQFEGHAGAGEYGYDIVCSAVSALSISTVNAIESFTKARVEEEEADEEGGFLKVILAPQYEEDHDAQLLMKALHMGISQMADSYPENLRIRHIER